MFLTPRNPLVLPLQPPSAHALSANMDLVRAAARHVDAIAVRCPTLGAFSYGQLLGASEALVSQLGPSLPAAAAAASRGALDGPRIGVYAQPGPGYVASTWAAWMAGGIAVPLAVSHPPAELDYVLSDAGVSAVLAPASAAEKLKDVCHSAGAVLHVLPEELLQAGSSTTHAQGSAARPPHSAKVSSSSTQGSSLGALIVYTSGTTGRPKGALHTHGSLAAQVDCLVSAWQWAASDTIVHALPLHHVHGIINALYCPHVVGAAVNFLPSFSPAAVWEQLQTRQPTVLMAVPTMYSYLLSHYQQHMSPQQQAAARAAAAGLRLTVSGSAAAPVPLLQQWQALSGQMLLERYGMTETGMILSNPYEGERRPGFVGLPLPGVEVKVLPAEAGHPPEPDSSRRGSATGEVTGELAVAGPALFREYWGRPEATAAAFDADGFFLTGDTVSYEGQPPYYKIQGRTTVDIIKSGGFKLSALDIESALLHHPGVSEVAVLGVPDEQLGQRVAALVVAAGAGVPQEQLVQGLQALCEASLPLYSVPRQWLVLSRPLPRNAMGKVNKKALLAAFQQQLMPGGGGSMTA